MIDRISLRTAAENAMEAAGASLAASLYRKPMTIGISGPLGVGKTTFLRGFLREMGIAEHITSPTYALEQRYDSRRGEIIHLDLYRLAEADARRLLLQSDDHRGIRCIEWPEHAGDDLHPDILVRVAELPDRTRAVHVEWHDTTWPDDAMIDAWRTELLLPENVANHCDAVAAFSDRIASALIERGTIVRPRLLHAAARAHDLFRFMDFRPSASPANWQQSDEQERLWRAYRERYGTITHEEAAERFLTERGFLAAAAIVGAHIVTRPIRMRDTIEQHIVYYADKRFIGDRFVTIAERYEDFGRRYGGGTRSLESLQWEQDAYETERILFPDGMPL